MKILSAHQQQEADAHTIANEPIASINLMERASKRWVEHALPFLNAQSIYIFTGFGNNGGDGLAIARLLTQHGFKCHVIHAHFGKELSRDCKTNLERLPEDVIYYEINSIDELKEIDFEHDSALIDALFGSGLTRPLKGEFAEVVNLLDTTNAKTKLAVDVPSGLFTDKMNDGKDTIARCDLTITFQAPKLSFLFPENYEFVGHLRIANIDLDKNYISNVQANHFYLTESFIKTHLKKRSKFSHKGTFGHLGIIKGTEQTMGASYLAALAGFNAGAGLVSLLDFDDAKRFDQWPQLMHKSLKSETLSNFTICIGPGLGTDKNSMAKLELCFNEGTKPLVIDADALNLIASKPSYLDKIPTKSILTPHPKELERLIGKTDNSFEQLDKAKAFAKKHNVVLLIKRAHTAIINSDGKVYFNATGNPGLAKAGSGDVLAGIIASFLCQGYEPIIAAQIGVYLHGKAADDLKEERSEFSFTPQMLIEQIGKSLKNLGV
jgi:NAD(P)H-hydrate epimerase